MPVGTGGRGEAEHRRRVGDDREAVGDDRPIVGIALGLEIAHQAGNRVRHAVGGVTAGIAEGDPRQRRRPHHLRTRLEVAGVGDRAHHVGAEQPHGLAAAEVAPRVGALALRPEAGAGRRSALGEGPGGVGFDGVAEHVERARRHHVPRQGAGDVGIDDGPGRAQVPRHDAGLRAHLREVEDGDAGTFAARARGGGTGDMGLQRSGYGRAAADRGVDVGEEIGRIGGIEVGGLAGVDHRAAAKRNEAVETTLLGELRRLLEGVIGGLDAHLVIDDGVDAGILERSLDDGGVLERADALVRHQDGPGDAETAGVVADLGEHPRPEGYRRNVDGERRIAGAGRREIMTTGQARSSLTANSRDNAPYCSRCHGTVKVASPALSARFWPDRAVAIVADRRLCQNRRQSGRSIDVPGGYLAWPHPRRGRPRKN